MAVWHLEGCLDETQKTRKISLTQFPFVIGRSKSIDMVVLLAGISRRHAEIFKKDGRLYIRDLGSTNGTFVNKRRINGDTLLTHKTLIHFAQYEFQLIDSEYKTSLEGPVTVIMNPDDSPDLSIRSDDQVVAGKQNDAEAKLHTPSANSESDQDSGKSESASTVDPQDHEEEKGASASPVHPSPFLQSDENVFVQGRWDQSNRRKHPRREARWPTVVTLKNQKTIQCTTKDISETGLALKSPMSLKHKTLIKIEIQAFYKGRNHQITAIGMVRHSLVTADGFIVGVHLKHCAKGCGEFLKQFTYYEI